MHRITAVVALSASFWAVRLEAQTRVAVRHLHERAIVISQMTGSGTYLDPKRPAVAPAAADYKGPDAIVSYTYEVSDDGRFAIVEIAARTKAGLAKITRQAAVVRAFEKGKDKPADVLSEARRYKKAYAPAREEVRP